jgi:D-xylose 1-dehydrogenase (NADP+, D-xylono-1,5-lactone-forming)
MSVRWGLMSTARINDALLGSGHGEFVAVASRSPERAEAYAAEKGIPRAHGSYEALLADPDVDAVYVGLPNALHVPWTIRALRAGKHVLCEKPMSRRPAEVEEAFAVAEEQGLVLAEAFMWRHHPQLARARELVGSGAIGRLRLIRASFSFVLTDELDVRLQRDLDGGALMDVGCYCVSGARALVGTEPERVQAEQVLGGDGVDVALAGVMRFGDGVLATVDCALTSGPRSELEAIGDAGSLLLRDPWHGWEPVVEHRRADGVERIEVAKANSYALELEDFEAAVRGERRPLLDRADALGQARAIAALYASAESKEQ